ncbi:hypothetical protein SAMN02745227_01178 [Anaerobranca californiensis DSM 14826]|uniref:DRTGG domain-containing protein n=1 Tax=Anaerobranca californiensis DSM 14826 TaxID=1120989 RepID=A0A1M6NLY3_9FIRM|nr:hypothetical protein [Anaerobranca californiensis]SHJ96719.1 hypothetical protein SAMN02745227_01178 [Anaerobranca californiensis DSM 14826]
MILKGVVEKLNLKPINIKDLELEVQTGLCTDLLSLVIGNSEKNSIWITHQGHVNIVAVALLAELAAVVVVGEVEEGAQRAALEKGLNLFTTNETAFEVVGKLYSLGIRGKNVKA